MTELIRSATLTHYARLARSVELDPAAMLRKVRLPVTCLERRDLRIPVRNVRRLLELSADESGVETFGLRLAEYSDGTTLGPLALLIREQATIGTALEALSRFIHIHNEGMRLAIDRQDDFVTVTFLLRGGALRQATELAVGTINRTIGLLCAGDWRPLEIHFAHGPPRSRRFHRQFFGCELAFHSDFDGIVCAAGDLEQRIPTASPELARFLEGRIEVFEEQLDRWDARVAMLVRVLLPGGDCSIERVAEHLGCDRRTIHRHLAECGTTFSKILDDERAEIVTRLIDERSRPLTEIAEMIGFSAQSAMARWFRGRFGCSVTEWRGDPRERMRMSAGRW
jgi:AraC-like DNA-binding protein